MDFENVFWIFLLVVYLVLQVLGKKRRRKKPPPLPEGERTGGRETGEHTLAEALREIRHALGVETPPHAPEPAHTPAIPQKTAPPRRAPEFKSPSPLPADEAAGFARKPLPQPIPLSRLQKRLRDADSVREAVILSEILGPPMSRRRR